MPFMLKMLEWSHMDYQRQDFPFRILTKWRSCPIQGREFCIPCEFVIDHSPTPEHKTDHFFLLNLLKLNLELLLLKNKLTISNHIHSILLYPGNTLIYIVHVCQFIYNKEYQPFTCSQPTSFRLLNDLNSPYMKT